MSNKIKCQVCGKEFKQITHKHTIRHGLTINEYISKYPDHPVYSATSIALRKKLATEQNASRKGIPRSPETILKIKESKKNNSTPAWNCGIAMSDEQKEHLSDIATEQYRTGAREHWNLGGETSIETKNKISDTLKSQNLTYSAESKQKRKDTIAEKERNGWVHHNTMMFRDKLKNSINVNANELFNDREWLYDQHITKRQTLASICVKLGLHWQEQATTLSKQFNKLNIPIHRYTQAISAQQQSLEDFISSLGIEFVSNTRKEIAPYELDIYIPSHNLAVEYNGLYWHSEAAKKDAQTYHLMKTELCENNGIRLIHIFEDEWRDQQQQCKDTLTHLLGMSEKGVYARKTTITEIPWKTASAFLEKHHLLGAGTSGNYRIGAYSGDELIGVMVFGKMSNEKADQSAVELKRFVTNKKNNPGLGSKMFKHAVSSNGYREVIAFVDRRWFTGGVKDHIGFTLIGTTKPSIWWVNGTDRFHRRFMNKKQLIKDGHDSSLSKREILLSLGFVRIWDCGKLKLKWVC